MKNMIGYIKMKMLRSLFIITGMFFGTMTAFAQEVEVLKEYVTPVAEIEDNFAETIVAELSEVITNVVIENYPTATINNAYINDNKYKLEVSLEDGTSGTLYLDDEGNWIDI